MRYLFYQGNISEAGVRNVEILLNVALHDGENEVVLCLASHGGSVNAGIGLYNYIQMLPLKVHTHTAGICESIAVTLMLAGDERSAAPLSAFSLHAAIYSDGPLAGQISPNTDLIANPFREKLSWTNSDVEARFGTTDFRFGADEAKSFGLISTIRIPKLGEGDQMIPVNVP